MLLECSQLQFLVTINIALHILKWLWDWTRPKGLSSFEYHYFRHEDIEKLEKILQDDNKQRRTENFQNYLRISDAFKNYAKESKSPQTNKDNEGG